MAGSDPYLTKLRSVLRTLDDDALAVLANRGLLRRARKDLESVTPSIRCVKDGLVEVNVADEIVQITEHPSAGKCTCPSAGICRHILAALLYLRDDAGLAAESPVEAGEGRATGVPPQAAETEGNLLPTPAEVFGNLDEKSLQKWAGKTLLRKATRFLAGGPTVEIEAGAALLVRFPDRNVTCRWIPSGELTGMLCSCQAETVCEHMVAAVLAYQVSLGRKHVEIERTVLQESSGAPRSRAEVLQSVRAVLCEIVSLGLARLSLATANRLTTLAVSAHGVDLPRLERMLKSLADEIHLALRRDAQSSTARLLTQVARIEALRLGLATSQSAALVGQHRSQYFEVGQITLVGLGAQVWQSKGGYRGLTVYFWDQSRDAWATWSESRPAAQTGFSPAGRFLADGPWVGCTSPREASRSTLRLTSAWRNSQGRISGRPATRALVLGPSRPREVSAAIRDWSVLAEKAGCLFGGSLASQTENLDLVLLLPQSWDVARFDSLRQELRRPVYDEQGRTIDLWLPFTAEQEKAIERLEQFPPQSAPGDGLLGALRLVSGSVCVQPISLFSGDRIISLNLEDAESMAPAKTGKKPPPANDGNEEEQLEGENEELVPQTATATPLGRILIAAQAELESVAEGGIAARRDRELLAGAARRLDALGLTTCSRPIKRLLELIASSSRLAEPACRNKAAAVLLHAYYLLRLAADQETFVAACTGLKSTETLRD